MHRHVLRRCMKRHGVLPQYSKISNHDLDILTWTFKAQRPESGICYLVGFLWNHGLWIQCRHVRLSMKRVDGLGQVLRQRKVIQRKQYRVKQPNTLWHLNGHHKLIRWGIVIHGFVDGYSRTVNSTSWVLQCKLTSNLQVVALKASTNNRVMTVLELFLDALDEYGMPSRMRGDRGGENIYCAIYMVMRNGPDRSSFIWGSWVHLVLVLRPWYISMWA